jgi:disulfide oxidoreductase YuzD
LKLLLLFLLIVTTLFSRSHLISPIPAPTVKVLNQSLDSCPANCQETLKTNEYFLSLIAMTHGTLSDHSTLLKNYENFETMQWEHIKTSDMTRIALVVPYKQIGRYAQSIQSTVFAYLSSKKEDFNLKPFYIEDESELSLKEVFKNIEELGFHYVIAPLTINGATNLNSFQTKATIFIPTVNKHYLQFTAPNIFYGGINYKEQMDQLLTFASLNIALFYDESQLGHSLNEILYQDERPKNILFTKALSNKTSNFKDLLFENEDLNGSSVVLNTPLVKSSLVMSQLTLYENPVSTILSTQINYDPLLLSITQYNDRKNMLIANSVIDDTPLVSELASLLHADLRYDWINHAAGVGIDFLYASMYEQERQFKEEIVENQVVYPTVIMRPTGYRFVKVNPEELLDMQMEF